jgi:osmotically-inducible protein OsmY
MIDLYDAVVDALWRYAPVRDELGFLKVQVDPEGNLVLSGNVRSSLVRDGVLETVYKVPGVRAIEDRMLPDHELEVFAAQTIASDSKTQIIPAGSISIRSHLGAVKINGKVDEPMLEAVVELVSNLEGVRSVDVI